MVCEHFFLGEVGEGHFQVEDLEELWGGGAPHHFGRHRGDGDWFDPEKWVALSVCNLGAKHWRWRNKKKNVHAAEKNFPRGKEAGCRTNTTREKRLFI